MKRPKRCPWRDSRRRQEKAAKRHKVARYRGRRTDLPRRIFRALDLSDFAADFTPEWLVATLKDQHFWPLIEAATRKDWSAGDEGRPPLQGSWALLLCVFVLSKKTSLTEFLLELTPDELARLGFEFKPSKGALWDNLSRIENDCLGVFADGAWFVVRRLDRQLNGDMLRDCWWDSSTCLSPSRWYHCCEDVECPRKLAETARRRSRPNPSSARTDREIKHADDLPDDVDADDSEEITDARARQPDQSDVDEDDRRPKSGGVPQLPSRESLIRRLYGDAEAEADRSGTDPDAPLLPTRSPLLLARDQLDAHRGDQGLRPPDVETAVHYGPLIDDYDGPGKFFTLRSTGCLYWTADEDAAVRRKGDHRPESKPGDKGRRYTGRGEGPELVYDVSRLVSWGSGLVLGIIVKSEHESRLYRPLLDEMLERTPYKPRAVVTDATGGLRPVSDVTAEHGIGHISPSFGYGRTQSHKWVDDEHGRWDRFGIPRCKYCGAPCRYQKARPLETPDGEIRWRLLFRCSLPQTDECEKSQSMYVDEDTRILTTIWRDRAVYWALRGGRGTYERAHHLDRKRFHVTTDQHLVRRGRKGVRHQQLLGEIVMLITALKMAWLQGILDGLSRVPKRVSISTGEAGLAKFHKEYRAAGLHLPRPDFVKLRQAFEAARVRRSPSKPGPDQLE